jgi:hypothetical protein
MPPKGKGLNVKGDEGRDRLRRDAKGNFVPRFDSPPPTYGDHDDAGRAQVRIDAKGNFVSRFDSHDHGRGVQGKDSEAPRGTDSHAKGVKGEKALGKDSSVNGVKGKCGESALGKKGKCSSIGNRGEAALGKDLHGDDHKEPDLQRQAQNIVTIQYGDDSDVEGEQAKGGEVALHVKGKQAKGGDAAQPLQVQAESHVKGEQAKGEAALPSESPVKGEHAKGFEAGLLDDRDLYGPVGGPEDAYTDFQTENWQRHWPQQMWNEYKHDERVLEFMEKKRAADEKIEKKIKKKRAEQNAELTQYLIGQGMKGADHVYALPGPGAVPVPMLAPEDSVDFAKGYSKGVEAKNATYAEGKKDWKLEWNAVWQAFGYQRGYDSACRDCGIEGGCKGKERKGKDYRDASRSRSWDAATMRRAQRSCRRSRSPDGKGKGGKDARDRSRSPAPRHMGRA